MAVKMDLTELGSTGLVRASGFVQDEFITALQGKAGRRVLREMGDNEAVIASYLFAIEKILQRLDWGFEPYSEDHTDDGESTDQDSENAVFADECLNDMSTSWDNTLSEILSMLVFGFSFHEVVYKKRVGPDQKDGSKRSKFKDGRIGWRRWGIRGQETLQNWEFDEDGGVRAMVQFDPVAGGPGGGGKGIVTIPIERALLFRTSVRKNNPEGKPLIRTAYVPWFYKKVISEIEAIGIERDLAGMPVAWMHPDYFAADAPADMVAVREAMVQIVQSVKRNEQDGVLMPLAFDEHGNKMFDLTLMASAGSRQIDIDKTIQRYDQRIAMATLSDFILLGHERVGSYSLGASKMDLWTMAIDSIANSIATVVNDYAVPRLFAYNGLPLDRLPKLTYGDVAHVDLTEIADYIQKLGGAGAIAPDDKLEDHLRELAGLPPADQEARDQRHQQAEAMAEMAVQAADPANQQPPAQDGKKPPVKGAPGAGTAPKATAPGNAAGK